METGIFPTGHRYCWSESIPGRLQKGNEHILIFLIKVGKTADSSFGMVCAEMEWVVIDEMKDTTLTIA